MNSFSQVISEEIASEKFKRSIAYSLKHVDYKQLYFRYHVYGVERERIEKDICKVSEEKWSDQRSFVFFATVAKYEHRADLIVFATVSTCCQ